VVCLPGRTVNGLSRAGAVEVFRFSQGRWGSPTELNLGRYARQNGDMRPVLSADGRTIAVGDFEHSINGKEYAGAVYVFRFDQKWSGPTELSLGGQASTEDLMGFSVALS